MTEEPLDYLYELASQKPPLPTRAVFGQLERMSDQLAFLQAAQQYHYQAGLALDLFTPLDSLADNVWPHLDTILLLAVPMGAQGQTFQDSVFAKITALQKILTTHSSSAKIYLDGGITTTQIPALQKLGLAGVAMGSFFWSGKFKSSLQN
jgi:pentose-5-phosphate-3-epimerase